MEGEELFSSSVDGVCLAAKDEVTGASRMVSSERTNCFSMKFLSSRTFPASRHEAGGG